VADQPVIIDSKYKVAFELMRYIEGHAEGEPEENKRDRNYYLKLYWQCIRMGETNNPDGVLRASDKSQP
jgi:hypothetical protein